MAEWAGSVEEPRGEDDGRLLGSRALRPHDHNSVRSNCNVTGFFGLTNRAEK